jgi:hypothetical protein
MWHGECITDGMQFKITNKWEGGEKNMKKVLMLVLAIIIGVAFVTTVYAAEEKKAPATDKPAAAAPEKPAKEKAVEKAKKAGMKKFEGEFVSKDDAAKTIVVKGETEMTFDVSKAKMGKKVAAGDKVVVAYTEKDGKNIAKSVTKAGAAKEKKAEKKMEKKEEKPAAAPAAEKPAAPAPAPAKK